MQPKPTIGFIGQGWIGKHYADDFENRGFPVVRYSVEPQHVANKEKIAECDIVFIAVPTPTTPQGFDDSIIRSVVPLVGKGKIAVIKSTLLPGLTIDIQKQNPDRIVLHSPEFLMVSRAAHDAAHPDRNIVGIPVATPEHKKAALLVLQVLAYAPFKQICSSTESELIKYAHNIHGYVQIVFSNLLYEVVQKTGADWEVLKDAMMADPMMSHQYLDPIHKSGRGAGGLCFIKDFAIFKAFYGRMTGDVYGEEVLRTLERKNNNLLTQSNKDLDLLKGVYGDSIPQ